MKLFFDDSALPALERLFSAYGLEIVDQSVGGLDPWYTVQSCPAEVDAVPSMRSVPLASTETETYNKGDGVLGPERLNLRNQLEER